MSIVTTVAEVIVMPSLHRAKVLNAVHSVKTYLLTRGLVVVACITLPTLLVTRLYMGDVDIWVFVLLAPMPFLSVYTAVNIGLLNTEGCYRQAALVPVGGACLALMVVTLAPKSILFLAFSFLSFEVGRAVWAWFSTKLSIQRTDVVESIGSAVENLKKWSSEKTKHQILASLFISLVPFVDLFFASQLQSGSVTLIELANRLWNVVPLVLSGHTLLFYAYFSREASTNAISGHEVNSIAMRTGAVALLLSLLLVPLSGYIVDLLYGYGSIGEASRLSLAVIFSCYLFGAAPFVIVLVYGRALSAEGRNIILVKFSIVNLLLNILLNILFIRLFGLKGIAISTSVSTLIGSILLYRWSGYGRAS